MNNPIQLTSKAWAVTVPEDAYNFEVYQGTMDRCLIYQTDDNIDDFFPTVPVGDWQILGIAEDIKESKAQKIVDKIRYKDPFTGAAQTRYSHYSSTITILATTALESLFSLLKSHSLDPSTTLIILKQEV